MIFVVNLWYLLAFVLFFFFSPFSFQASPVIPLLFLPLLAGFLFPHRKHTRSFSVSCIYLYLCAYI